MGSWEREAWVSSLRIVDGRGDKDGFEKFGAIDTCRVQFESGRRATGCFCPPSMKPAWVLSLRYLFVACALEASRYLTYVLPLVDENIRIGTTRVQALDREAKRSLNGRCHRRCWQSSCRNELLPTIHRLRGSNNSRIADSSHACRSHDQRGVLRLARR